MLPALLVMAWLLAGLPLLLAGRFTPVLMLALSVPLAAVLVVLGLRWLPGRWHGALPVQGPQQARTPWWAVAGVVADGASRAFTFASLGQQVRRIALLKRSGYQIVFSRDGYLVLYRSGARQPAG